MSFERLGYDLSAVFRHNITANLQKAKKLVAKTPNFPARSPHSGLFCIRLEIHTSRIIPSVNHILITSGGTIISRYAALNDH